LVLVGIEPDDPDPELGYIVPGRALRGGAYGVQRFIEKPPVALANNLLAAGALWNSFIFAGHASSLLGLFRQRTPESVDAIGTALARQDQARALASLYEGLPVLDFSRAITQGGEALLSVVASPSCGWSDLGTPKRVAQALERLNLYSTKSQAFPGPTAQAPGLINLAAEHARLRVTSWGTAL